MKWDMETWGRVNEMRAEGLTNKEIGEVLGCKVSVLHAAMKRRDPRIVLVAKKNSSSEFVITPYEREYLIAHYRKDLAVWQIRKELHKKSPWMRMATVSLGLKEMNGNNAGSKWTPEEDAQLRAALVVPISLEELGEAFGRTAESVRKRSCFLKITRLPVMHERPDKESRKIPLMTVSVAEAAYLREHYRVDQTNTVIGRYIGRGTCWIGRAARLLGLNDRPENWHAPRGKPRVVRAPTLKRDPRPSWDALPAGHPVSWGILQAMLSPANREPWPRRREIPPLEARSCLDVSAYAGDTRTALAPGNFRLVGAVDAPVDANCGMER